MAEKKFVWLLDSSYPRTGPKLVRGQEHNASLYPAAVVDEWVRTGAAEWVEPAGKAKKPAEGGN